MRPFHTIVLSIIATAVFSLNAVALTPHTSYGTFSDTAGEADWDAFEWTWTSPTEAMDVDFEFNVSDGNVLLRMMQNEGGPIGLEAGPFAISGGTNATLLLPSTNIPVWAIYYAEIVQVEETDPTQYKSLARGTIAREWSSFDTTNFIGETTSVQLEYSYGTNNTANWDEAYDWVNTYSNITPTYAWVINYVSTTAVTVATTNLENYTLTVDVNASNDVQDAALTTHVTNATGAHAASAIAFTPAGDIVATTVQAAIEELDAEAAKTGSDASFSSVTTTNTAGTNNLASALTILGSKVRSGSGTSATGTDSHAEGTFTTASGEYSHAEGYGTNAGGDYSHAGGHNSTAAHANSYVWSDGIGQGSSATKQYTVYARGGIRLLGGVGVEVDGDLDADNITTTDASGTNVFAGKIQGGILTATYSASGTLLAAEHRGYIIYVDAASTLTLLPVADGDSVTVITIGDIAVSVNPDDGDKIFLDGVALDDGDQIDNASTAGNTAVLTYKGGDWYAATGNIWTDGS